MLQRVGQPIACGTYSIVYKARDLKGSPQSSCQIAAPATDPMLAVKRVLKSANTSFIGALAEADMLHRLRHHPYIVTVGRFVFGNIFTQQCSPLVGDLRKGQVDDQINFVFPCAEHNLIQHIAGHPPGTLYYETSMRYFTEIMIGVEYIQGQGIVHRDLKPGNVLIIDGSAQICDFGLSRWHTLQEPTTPNVGTWWYRSPECTLSLEYDYKSDVWSMGCILFELLCGRPWWTDPTDSPSIVISKILCALPEELDSNTYTKMIGANRKLVIDINPADLLCQRASFEKQLGLTALNIQHLQADGRYLYSRLCTLLAKMLTFDPQDRYSVTQVLNDQALASARNLIEITRSHFPIAIPLAGAVVRDQPVWGKPVAPLSNNVWGARPSPVGTQPGYITPTSNYSSPMTVTPPPEALEISYNSPVQAEPAPPPRTLARGTPIAFVECAERGFMKRYMNSVLAAGYKNAWFKKRVIFQGMSWFDRIMIWKYNTPHAANSIETPDRGHYYTIREVGLRLYVCLYLACKLFTTSSFIKFEVFAAPHFVTPADIAEAREIEGSMFEHIFKYKAYHETVLEALDDFNHVANDNDILQLARMYMHEPRINGMTPHDAARMFLQRMHPQLGVR